MDHNLAESLHSVEKYTLNEMSGAERTQFEEHLFDCPLCSEQVRQNFTAVETLKEVLREQPAASYLSVGTGWRDWLRPSSLVPTFAAAALACMLVYQYASGPGMEARVLPLASVVAPVARGEAPPVQLVDHKSPSFVVTFSVDGLSDSFVCEFLTTAGKKIISIAGGPESVASFNLPVELPAKNFPPGSYRMILRPVSKPDSIKTYPFVIDYSK